MTPFDGTLREVLNGRKYDRLTGRAVDFGEMVFDFFRRVIAFILDLFNIRLPDGSGYNTNLYAVIFTAAGIIILLAAAGVILRKMMKRRRGNGGGGLSDIFEELARKNYTLDELLKLSDARSAEGHMREAVRFRFIAELVALRDKKILRLNQSKTNAQLLYELTRNAPGLADSFAKTVDFYHAAWFGGKPVTAEKYAGYSALIKKILFTDGFGA
ncbi:MAG: DUF4129 domain-containing protein [Clostridiales bacterium]|jgi:hypothetical protein|nr:DUF4129 domain-containing protein [Clostridiales bacterium]